MRKFAIDSKGAMPVGATLQVLRAHVVAFMILILIVFMIVMCVLVMVAKMLLVWATMQVTLA